MGRGDVQGLRVDHIDGLYDPAAYIGALRRSLPQPVYLTVEKILARYETLPAWPVEGTTGYDFANQVAGLLVDAEAEAAMTRLISASPAGTRISTPVLLAAKQRIMRVNLASEMNVLARRFHRLSMSRWRTRDFTRNGMLAALEEVVAAFPVYRTYVDGNGASEDDRRYIGWAIAQAKKRWRSIDTSIFDFLHRTLSGRRAGGDAVSAGDRAGHGQGFGRYGLLSLFPAARAERGRRRSAPLRPIGRGVSPRDARAGAGLAARDAGDRDARHQARRGCADPAGDAVGNAAPLGAMRRPLAARQPLAAQ